MAIRIARKGQTWEKTIRGTTFILQKEEPEVRQALMVQYLQQPGQAPQALQYAIARLERGVVGWRDLLDLDGQPVPFGRDLLRYLGDEDRSELLAALNEGPDPLAPPSMPTSPTSSGMPPGERPTAA